MSEQSREETINNADTVEELSFSLDSNFNVVENTKETKETQPLLNDDDDFVEATGDITDEVVIEDSVTIDIETESPTDDKVEDESEEMEFNLGDEDGEDDEEGKELTTEEKLLKRIEELEAKEKAREAFKEIEQLPKDEFVMPNISKYDFAVLAKEYSLNGSLSEESYKALADKQYSKEMVDSYITEQLQKQSGVVTQEAEQKAESQEQVMQRYANKIDISLNQFNMLFEAFGNAISHKDAKAFEAMDEENQIKTLMSFKEAKDKHEANVKAKKNLVRAKSVAAAKKQSNQISIADAEKGLSKAIKSGDARLIDYYNTILAENDYLGKMHL